MSAILVSVITWVFRILLGVFILGTLVIPTFFSDKMIKHHTNYISPNTLALRKRLSRLSTQGKLFIVCALLSIMFGWVLSYLDDKEKEDHFTQILQIKLDAKDSISKEREQTYRYKDSLREIEKKSQVNSVQDTVNDLKHIVKEKAFEYSGLSSEIKYTRKENALLQKEFNSPVLSPALYNEDKLCPHLMKDTINGRLTYWIYYKNSGKGIAKNLRTSSIILTSDGNELRVEAEGRGEYNDKRNIAEPDITYGYAKFFQPTDKRQAYVCFQVRYQNALGEERLPYRMIYYYDVNFVDKEIPVLANSTKEIIEEYLIKNGYWK